VRVGGDVGGRCGDGAEYNEEGGGIEIVSGAAEATRATFGMAFMMRKIAMMLACAGLLAGAGCAAKTEQAPSSSAGTKYTCPMHPEVVQDKPGSCSKCEMKLVEKK